MVGLLLPVMLGIGLGFAAGGSLEGWAHVKPRWWPAVVASLVVLLFLYNPPIDRQAWAIQLGPLVSMATMAVLLAALIRNSVSASTRAARWAFALAALGVASNLTVMLANGGYMPQSAEAHRAVWGTEPVAEPGQPTRLTNTTVLTADSRLAMLSDVIAEPAWLPKANVISVGDALLAVGLGCWAFQVTASHRQRQKARQIEAL